MLDVIVYSNTSYHITEGRKSIFQGQWKINKGGVYVEYPPEEIIPLSSSDRIKIKKAIIEYYKDSLNKSPSEKRSMCNKPMVFKFEHLAIKKSTKA